MNTPRVSTGLEKSHVEPDAGTKKGEKRELEWPLVLAQVSTGPGVPGPESMIPGRPPGTKGPAVGDSQDTPPPRHSFLQGANTFRSHLCESDLCKSETASCKIQMKFHVGNRKLLFLIVKDAQQNTSQALPPKEESRFLS